MLAATYNVRRRQRSIQAFIFHALAGRRKDDAVARILVVEDEASIVRVISLRLERLGHDILWADNGLQALETTREQRPDLILLDVMLPLLDGFEVLKQLKDAPDTQHIPVIMLTARGYGQDVATGLGGGAEDYIVKPFSFPELIARVNTALARHAH